MLRKWEDLPENMRNSAVRPYYDVLRDKRAALLLKRGFDVLFSILLLVLLSPLFVIIGTVIKFDDGGKMFFRQVRVTQYGRPFRIFKFRTMVANADKLGAEVTSSCDPRITRAGTFLRRYRLDEIPQLINILAGDMSFVGTRPEVLRYVEAYTDEMMATLLLPAGVTSETSIIAMDESELMEAAEDPDAVYVDEILPVKMELNLEYVMNFSICGEFKTIIRTVAVVFGGIH